MTNSLVITAADDQYFTLAQDWLASIRALTFTHPFDLAILDVGLSATSRAYFEGQGVTVKSVGVDIEYPGRAEWERQKPGLRTLTARPSLRTYFPGYDVYIWVDTDMWMQTPDVINDLIPAVAKSAAIHIACEFDRCYATFFTHAAIWQIFRNWYADAFGDQVAGFMTLKPMLNAGLFAMNKQSPGWDAWHAIYSQSLQKLAEPTDKGFMVDQLGLNLLVYQQKVPVVVLPALYNWLTFYALPKFDPVSGLYVEPLPPYRPIANIHLTQKIKEQVEHIQRLDGQFIDVPLTFCARPKAG